MGIMTLSLLPLQLEGQGGGSIEIVQVPMPVRWSIFPFQNQDSTPILFGWSYKTKIKMSDSI